MARTPVSFVVSVAALTAWAFTSSCSTGDSGNFGNSGGAPTTNGSVGGAGANLGGSNGTNAPNGNGGAIVGTVNPDAGTFEPVKTVEDPETPYVTTCDSCPASEPLHVQCSSGCCCAHYCEGQFGSLTDKPCCDEQGGVIGLNCAQ